MLPLSIIDLYFGDNFNKNVDMLPTSIKTLGFGHNFNQSVDNLPPSTAYLFFLNKCLLKILYVSNRMHTICKTCTEAYTLTKNKCIKNENTPFSKHKINFEMIYKKNSSLFHNIRKIPYGCVYDSIVYT